MIRFKREKTPLENYCKNCSIDEFVFAVDVTNSHKFVCAKQVLSISGENMLIRLFSTSGVGKIVCSQSSS